MFNVRERGQVFTPERIVMEMLALRRNHGTVLEPSCGDGAFAQHLPNCTAIEIDAAHAPTSPPVNALVMDFFDYPATHQFETVIGNPPYVRYQDISLATKSKLDKRPFDERTNLYLFFIEKCLRHLKPHGELIFITPRDFLKATAAVKLNELLYRSGTITDFIELGDQRIFSGYTPNCAIWRFEKDDFSRRTNSLQIFTCAGGQLLFTERKYPVRFSDVFFVKVGAVSGADDVFTVGNTSNDTGDESGTLEFVSSATHRTGKTKRMIYNTKLSCLEPHKARLMARRIKPFTEKNWWQWGRAHYLSAEKRIYVNSKTRTPHPFFLHDSLHYDGSVLALFPHQQTADLAELCRLLNKINWSELGFVCDGRFLFSQRSLEQGVLPDTFLPFVKHPHNPAPEILPLFACAG